MRLTKARSYQATLALTLLCAVAGPARAGITLEPGGSIAAPPAGVGAMPFTDNPVPLSVPVPGGRLDSDGLVTTIVRSLQTGLFTFQYLIPVDLLAGLTPADSFVFRDFAGRATSIEFASPTTPVTTALAPLPALTTRSDDGSAITFADFRRVVDPSGPILYPLALRVYTDTTGFTAGRAELLRGGVVVSAFDTLAPIPAPEPSSLVYAGIAGVVGVGRMWSRARRGRPGRAGA